MKEREIFVSKKESMPTPLRFYFICPEDKEEKAMRYFQASPRCRFSGISEDITIRNYVDISTGEVTVVIGREISGIVDITQFNEVVRDLAKRNIAGYSAPTQVIKEETQVSKN